MSERFGPTLLYSRLFDPFASSQKGSVKKENRKMDAEQQAIFSNFLLFLLSLSLYRAETATSFEIDKVNHQFLLDVNPFIYLAREIHYFQIPTDNSMESAPVKQKFNC
ncbi:hypothetical protein L5515_018109 [Caenorhabditis briggsae]|uniref:Uncharacterized protein n=1 Tax=Caenorhabditis briggsae TaxID=6238 RepID=A0AAE9FLE0_CAEBR|nr:hypothetical protein L5515_018109 [Caenorhabditis briggsae]